MVKLKQRASFFLRACLMVLILAVAFPCNDAMAQKKTKKKKKPKQWEISAGLSSSYDNNILKYSDKYLDRFMNNEDEGRFHIDTYDDIVINPTLNTTYTTKIFGKKNSKINLNLSHKQYVVNPIKNFSSISVGFRQYFSKTLSFKVFYSYIPDFYIRHFRDDDWTDLYGYTKDGFQPMGFSKDNYGFWIQETFLKNVRVNISLSYMKYFYNKHFTEYDSNNLVYGLKVSKPLNKKVRLSLAYQFVTSDAKGYDQDFETKDTSNDSDGTYAEDIFIVGMSYSLPKIKKHSNSFNLETRFMKRYFSSSHYLEDDPTHAGRIDSNVRLYGTYNYTLSKEIKLSAFYNYYFRRTTSSAEANLQYLSDEKDYSQYQVGLKLVYTLKT